MSLNKEGRIVFIFVLLIGMLLCIVYVSPRVSFYLAQRSAHTNDLSKARDQLSTILAHDPSNVEALAAQSRVYAEQGVRQSQAEYLAPAALDVARRAIAQDPNDVRAQIALGIAYEANGEYEKARAVYQKILSADPANVEVLTQLAHSYDFAGGLLQAEDGYRKALSKNPNANEANLGLGHVLIRQERYQAALPYLIKASSVSNKVRIKSESLYLLGYAKFQLNDLDAAQEYMTQATKTEPSYPRGWTGLGMVLVRQLSTMPSGEKYNQVQTQALQALHLALSLNGSLTEAYMQVALLNNVMGNKEEAETMLAKALASMTYDTTPTSDEKEELARKISIMQSSLHTL